MALADDNLIEINRVAAKVNNEIVTWGEIDRAMTSLNFTNSEKKNGLPSLLMEKWTDFYRSMLSMRKVWLFPIRTSNRNTTKD